MVYALLSMIPVKFTCEGASVNPELEQAMKGHILAQGDLVGLYKKMK